MKPKPRAGGPAGTQTDRFVFNPVDRSLVTRFVDMGPVYYPTLVGTWKQVSALPNSAAW